MKIENKELFSLKNGCLFVILTVFGKRGERLSLAEQGISRKLVFFHEPVKMLFQNLVHSRWQRRKRPIRPLHTLNQRQPKTTRTLQKQINRRRGKLVSHFSLPQFVTFKCVGINVFYSIFFSYSNFDFSFWILDFFI